MILTDLTDGVFTLRFNRPDKKNSITSAMYTAMADAIATAGATREARCLLIAGAPEVFCAGNDLQDFLADQKTDESNPTLRFMRALAQFEKPVVAAINGPAIGIGSTLLLHCDLVYAGETARFQFPFVSLGICPEFGSTELMPLMMGHAKAAELLLLAEPFTSKTACEVGLVNAVLPNAEVEAHARSKALKFAALPPNALRVSKRLMKRRSSAGMLDLILLEANHFVPMLKQPEALEAIQAFLAKRKPDFSRFA
jgi:enoyl-CoA hydratase/carnithine racemase